MTYIFDMASGTEHQGEEMTCPKPSVTSKPDAPFACEERQVELRLATVETTVAPAAQARDYPHGLDVQALLKALED